MHAIVRIAVTFALATSCVRCPMLAQQRQALSGMFKDLDDVIAGDALILHGRQLFIDNDAIAQYQKNRTDRKQGISFRESRASFAERLRVYAGRGSSVVPSGSS